MKLATLFLALVFVIGAENAPAAEPWVSLPPADGIVVDRGTGRCGELVLNSGGDYETALGWQYGGVAPPYFGAFAECYSGYVEVCAVILDFTTSTGVVTASFDAYVWEDEAGIPGAILCMRIGVDPGEIAVYPGVSRLSVEMPSGCCTSERWWVGYWPDWPGAGAQWFVAADAEFFTGCPYNNIAPGIGYPTGWQNVSVAFGPHGSLGIGAEVRSCSPTSITNSTWGSVKHSIREVMQ